MDNNESVVAIKNHMATILGEMDDVIKKCEDLSLTNEQWFLNWMDACNKRSVLY